MPIWSPPSSEAAGGAPRDPRGGPRRAASSRRFPAELSASRHALIRETIYDDLPAARRVQSHCRIGEALEQRHVQRAESLCRRSRIIFCGSARGRRGARAHLRAAGRRAGARALRVRERRSYFEQALALFDRGAGAVSRACEVLLALGRTLARAGDPAGAKRVGRTKPAAARTRPRFGLAAGPCGAHRSRRVDGATPDDERIQFSRKPWRRSGRKTSALRARVLAQLAWELYYTGDVAATGRAQPRSALGGAPAGRPGHARLHARRPLLRRVGARARTRTACRWRRSCSTWRAAWATGSSRSRRTTGA